MPSNFAEYARRVAAAARKADADPTDAQREAGNHRVGSLYLHGHHVSITNPKGSIRRGRSPDGRAWQRVMRGHYGYIRRTTSDDGEQLDVYIGQHPESQLVFVVTQLDNDGNHDEYKAVIGCRNYAEARKLYLDHYPDGWGDDHVGEIRGFFMKDFREWLKKEKLLKKSAAEDKLPGGAADHRPDSDFPREALEEGREEELAEHTKDPEIAGEIAKDHMVEEGNDYYKRLAKLDRPAKSAFVSSLTKLADVLPQQPLPPPAPVTSTIPAPRLVGEMPMKQQHRIDLPKSAPFPGQDVGTAKPAPAAPAQFAAPQPPSPTHEPGGPRGYNPYPYSPLNNVFRPNTAGGTGLGPAQPPDSPAKGRYDLGFHDYRVPPPTPAEEAEAADASAQVNRGIINANVNPSGTDDRRSTLPRSDYQANQDLVEWLDRVGSASPAARKAVDQLVIKAHDPARRMGVIGTADRNARLSGGRPVSVGVDYVRDPEAWDIYRRFAAGKDYPVTYDPSEFAARSGGGYVNHYPTGTPVMTLTNGPAWPLGLVAAHEAQHVAQDPYPMRFIGRNPVSKYVAPGGSSYSELGPSVGDVALIEEWVRRRQKTLGQPVTGSGASVDFTGSAHPLSAGWMRDAAAEHGFLDGKPISPMLNTNAGRAWIRQQSGLDRLNVKGGSADDFASRNAEAKEEAKSSKLPHVRDGMYICGCGERYHAKPPGNKCPACGKGIVTARSVRR